MKTKVITTIMATVFLMSIIMVATPVSAKPQTFTVPIKQAQFQWRAWNPMPTEGSSWTELYQNNPTTIDCKLSGNVIHTYYTYSPSVSDLEGEQTIYVYDKKSSHWIEREGIVSYKYLPYYGDYVVANYWRGYLDFDGVPSQTNFIHGVAYQWCYVYAPEDAVLPITYPVWDDIMGAWLVGYSIYLWDADTATQSYTMNFHFVEPVPASNYNPLAK